MEHRVERERRSVLQVYARCSPWNRLTLDGELALRPVGTDADGRFGCKGFLKLRIDVLAKQLAGSFDECLW